MHGCYLFSGVAVRCPTARLGRSMQGDGRGGMEMVTNETVSVAGQIVGVLPEVAPDAERMTQAWRDDRRGERLENDRTGVTDPAERLEAAVEVDRTGAEIAAMALPDMHVPEPVAAVQERLEQVRLLDVHVVGVQVHRNPAVHCVEVAQCLPTSVDHIGLVSVDHLDGQFDSE